MEKYKKNTKKKGGCAKWCKALVCIAVMVVAFAIDYHSGNGFGMTMAFAVVAGVEGVGEHVTGAPLDTQTTRAESSELLENSIDEEILKITPRSTPIEQIMRYCESNSKTATSQIIEYYSVDTKPNTAKVATAVTANNAAKTIVFNTDSNDSFAVSDTILVKGVKGYAEKSSIASTVEDLVLYVQDKDADGKLIVQAVNGPYVSESYPSTFPAIPADTVLIRMGRAAGELDIQTEQMESIPTKESNFCQIFKMQVEQSTYQKMTGKEAKWEFSDIEEVAVKDMRMAMEKSFLFGAKRKIYDTKKKQDIYTTGGIWKQAGKEFSVTLADLDQKKLVSMMKTAFTGNGGSDKRVIIGGSDLTEAISNITIDKFVTAKETEVVWGIEFSKIVTIFGTVYYLHDEVFNEVGMPKCGLLFDPEYLAKYIFEKFGRTNLDLKTAGARNTEAVVLSECSCAVLKYPKAHMRIVGA